MRSRGLILGKQGTSFRAIQFSGFCVVNGMRGLSLDLRYVFRILKVSKGFALVAILSLAIGIGANTSVFSLVRSLLLESLPVQRPEEIAFIYRSTPEMRVMQVGSSGYTDPATGASYSSNFSYFLYQTLRRQSGASADVAGFNFIRQLSVSTEDRPAVIAGGLFASGNYFATLKVPIVAGRPLDDQDDEAGAPHAAVISYGFWQREFGGDPNAIGRNLTINGTPFQLVGVTISGFNGLSPGGFFPPTEVTVPLSLQPLVTPRWADEGVSMFSAQDRFWVRLIARVKPDASIAALQQSFSAAFRQGLTSAKLIPENAKSASVRMLPAGRGLDTLRRSAERPLYLMTVVVAVVLLIACVNLAGLMLARNVARQREMAVRLAIGGSRYRLIRQALLESLMLSIAGAVAGLLVALWCGPIILTMLTTGLGPVAVSFTLDWKLLATVGVIAITTALLSGLLPAMRLTSAGSLATHLGHRTSSGAPRLRTGRALIAVQVAISIPLVVGAGLFLRTVRNLANVDLGFDPQGLAFFGIDPSLRDNDPVKQARVYQDVLARLQAVPGVQSVSLVENALISGITSNTFATIGGQRFNIYKNAVGPHFLETMGMRLLEGRALDEHDAVGAPAVVVINETAARKYFQGSPIGQHIRYGSRDDEVVGVVSDSKYWGLRDDVEPTMFDSCLQRSGGPGALHLVVRTAVPPSSLETAIRRAVAEVDRDLPVAGFRTQLEQIDAGIGRERAFAALLGLFGGFALLLACIGLHGVTSYSVARRTGEIGIRMALGARRSAVLWLVFRQVVMLAAVGLLFGVPLAIAAAPAVRAMLFGVAPSDPATVVVAAATMFIVALAAGLLPARRAAKIEVLDALRHE
jgi:predicted permease